MNPPRIVRLDDAGHHLGALARSHVAAFGAQFPDWSVADACAELRAHAGSDGIPGTWVAIDGPHWQGSVSLLHEDHPRIHGLTPWLASLYVRPRARGQGLGAALVAHARAVAEASGVARLYLYCAPELAPWYARLGWQLHAKLDLAPCPPVQVMACTPRMR